ncbi:MAG: hypothetical protein QFB86_01520 [Patescibacteria group bacterium]|nr:hypothetical protein [Patescibacteria group bacterium]
MNDLFTPQLFGILSLATIFFGLAPYYVDIIRGNTRPQRAAMFIFAGLSVISFSGQLVEGAQASLFFAGALLANQLILFALALKYGMGGFDKKDKIALLMAVFILVIWYFTKSAVVALLLTTLVNTIAKILVTIKVYKYPHTELLYAWNMSVLASIFGALAVGKWDWVLLLVPVQNGITVGVIALTIFLRRSRVNMPKQDPN